MITSDDLKFYVATAGTEVRKVISLPEEVRATAFSLYLPSRSARLFNAFIWAGNRPFCPTTDAPLRTLDTVMFPRSVNSGTGSSLNACHNLNCSQPSYSSSLWNFYILIVQIRGFTYDLYRMFIWFSGNIKVTNPANVWRHADQTGDEDNIR